MQWELYNIEYIISKKDANGVSLLGLFLKDYSKLFNTQNINASCVKCLKKYHSNYIKKVTKMQDQNKSNYKLKEKYQNIPLVFGSNIFVNNDNITDEYAIKLLERYKDCSKIFSEYPKEVVEVVDVQEKEIEVEQEETQIDFESLEIEEPKQRKRRKKNN